MIGWDRYSVIMRIRRKIKRGTSITRKTIERKCRRNGRMFTHAGNSSDSASHRPSYPGKTLGGTMGEGTRCTDCRMNSTDRGLNGEAIDEAKADSPPLHGCGGRGRKLGGGMYCDSERTAPHPALRTSFSTATKAVKKGIASPLGRSCRRGPFLLHRRSWRWRRWHAAVSRDG